MKTIAQRLGIALSAAAVFLAGTPARASVDPPNMRTWFMRNSGLYARIVPETGVAEVTTWTRQAKPAYTDVQEVRYDFDYVYVRAAGLASYVMGPWYNDHNNDGILELLPGKPTNQHVVFKFSRKPVIPAAKTPCGVEAVGMWVNGVSIFNVWSGLYYNGVSDTMGEVIDKFWTCNAGETEAQTFDGPGGHQPDSGEYHYHQNPVGLRNQLTDSIEYLPDSGYFERPLGRHSPILGWANDGLPVYGPYGYSEPFNKLSGVRPMRTGYTLRNGSFGTTNLNLTGRHSLPRWAANLHGLAKTDLNKDYWGPKISEEYKLGHYTEDYDYLGDLGYMLGRDFDLNKYNARWCATPEFPNGTWAYFVTIDDRGTPVYPYVIAREYMGDPSSASRTNSLTWVDPGTTLYAVGGSESTPKILGVTDSTGVKTITWSSIEGAYYTILGSTGLGWSILASNLKSGGLETSYTIKKGDAGYDCTAFRVVMSDLDDFDSVFP